MGTGSRAETGSNSEDELVSGDESTVGIGTSSSKSDESVMIGTGSIRRLGLTSGPRLGLVIGVGLRLVQDLSLIFLGWTLTGGVEDSTLFILKDFHLGAIT